MKNVIKEYFHYSRLERNGIFILSFICMAFFLFPKVYQPVTEDSSVDFEPFKTAITAFEESIENKKEITNDAKTIKPFPFNPNTISEEELKKLGLNTKVIQTFLNFRSKGGRFYKKEDLKKVYGMTTGDYERLEAFINIEPPSNRKNSIASSNQENAARSKMIEPFDFDPNLASKEELRQLGLSERAANNLLRFRERGGVLRQKEELSKIYGVEEALFEKLLPFITIGEKYQSKKITKRSPPKAPEPEIKIQLDINSASKEEWQKLRGIGPYFADRIIESREKLGGFYKIEQVAEAYRLPDSTFQKIRPQLVLETPPKQLNINTITTKELARHPYIKYKQAKAIVNYRNQHGLFKDLKELDKIIALKQEVVEKMSPYFSLE